MLNLHNQGKLCLKKKFYRCLSVASLSMASTMSLSHIVLAADETVQEAPRKNYSIPAGPLSNAISEYAAETGVRLTFDPSIAKGKQTGGLEGEFSVDEGFNRLLKDSGLEAIDDQDGGYFLVTALPKLGEGTLMLEKVDVRAQRFYEVGPLPGLGLTKEEIPGNVQSISAKEIRESHSISMTDLFNTKFQGVTVNDTQSNPFQMDVQYRGFRAGPQIGTAQGLSVFFDGIRVNEPFGDVVNWDMIPMNAIANVDLFPGSNPIFGLNTLGGAFALKTKDGFDFTETHFDVLKGSFGREQLQAESGWNNGTIAFFGAGSFFMEDGWRDNSPSEVNQMFGKASYRGDRLDLNLSTLIVTNEMVGNGGIPLTDYEADSTAVFTSPDETENKLQQFQVSAAYQVNDKFSITGQVYRRNSKRTARGADVYTDFDNQHVKRNLEPGEEYTCLFETTNEYDIPDYYVMDIPDGDIFNSAEFMNFAFNGGYTTAEEAFASLPATSFNAPLPDDFVKMAQNNLYYWKNFQSTRVFQNAAGDFPDVVYGPIDESGQFTSIYSVATSLSGLKGAVNDPALIAFTAWGDYFYTTPDGVQHLILIKPPTNAEVCHGDIRDPSESGDWPLDLVDEDGRSIMTDGGEDSPTASGFVEGVPTGVLTDNTIEQITDGASIQFNWNTDHHKFMVGASIDRPTASYANTQQLGFFDANRDFYLDPDQARDQYAAADVAIDNNNFDGEQVTKSLYFSETWSPVETWHFSASARYNDTKGHNTMASRTHGQYVYSLARLEAFPNYYDVCSPGEDCPTGYIIPDTSNVLNESEREDYSYYSLNPSLGVAWQAKPNLNVYANFSQGVRVPSVIELGCALDNTPVLVNDDPITGEKTYLPRSVQENRTCSLPSTLSGDPYLPQIKAQTGEIGLRGQLGDSFQWNISAYQIDVKDDLYMITFPGDRSFFDTIGETRRRGLEAGFAGQKGKWGFMLNYSLTEATFQSNFTTAGEGNSSSFETPNGYYQLGRMIQVEPGDTMPGVPLHNLNATISYQATPKWKIGLTAVAHSSSYVRGNENNDHKAGESYQETTETTIDPDAPGYDRYLTTRKGSNNPGKLPGYVVFNLQSTYQFTKGLSATLLVNNIFDEEYFSAGALELNPFTPGEYGAIGPDGYNHNSLEWESNTFVSPGAPRAAWIGVNWNF
ncbi:MULTISPECIES: TonB-dependent receptor domain-containing protein [unclassified Methylophaga]|jgi:outer membrane receptor protein involved in Fe transport|uniref:TonB-dependent receptor domain-containing protein n=1 Tax=unclassified Methylophaga TaxID=2629249 RepID=UPI000C952B58|nr:MULTISPECIES: TonB-dependent receptor [unclassified Methylophaga]MAP27937.1 TonB-dependent receptor [Methylophaga sp.]|tara:strand:+ start:1325 stop:4858 length:3534 start_codon:yes stop_codon:yes gene_type:complete